MRGTITFEEWTESSFLVSRSGHSWESTFANAQKRIRQAAKRDPILENLAVCNYGFQIEEAVLLLSSNTDCDEKVLR